MYMKLKRNRSRPKSRRAARSVADADAFRRELSASVANVVERLPSLLKAANRFPQRGLFLWPELLMFPNPGRIWRAVPLDLLDAWPGRSGSSRHQTSRYQGSILS